MSTVVSLPRRPHQREKYKGPEETLRKMAIKIREAGRDPQSLKVFQPFAEAIIRKNYPPSVRVSHEQAAQIFLDYVRENVRYRPDPPLVELVKGAAITLCVPGAEVCIPVEDCDGRVVAWLSLCMAYGIEVLVIAQDFGPEEDLHVIGAIKSSTTEWLAGDPSHESMPLGKRVSAIKEVTMDPLNPGALGIDSPEGEFVSIGSLPHEMDGTHVAVTSTALILRDRPRFIASVPTGSWTLMAPASDGSYAIVAGTRYKLLVVTPATEPASNAQILLTLLVPLYWVWATGSAWTADDTTNLFSSQWLVEQVTPYPGTNNGWTVVGVAKANIALTSTKDITYSQVFQQASGNPNIPAAPTSTDTGGVSLPTGTKLLIGAVAATVVAAGLFAGYSVLEGKKSGVGRVAREVKKTRRKVKRMSKVGGRR